MEQHAQANEQWMQYSKSLEARLGWGPGYSVRVKARVKIRGRVGVRALVKILTLPVTLIASEAELETLRASAGKVPRL